MSGYEDIMTLPHHQSAKRPHMPRLDRAAQFAPFAALSGYEGEIAEAGRLTDAQAELTEWSVQQVDDSLQAVRRMVRQQPEVTLTYFVPDKRKSGGAYRTINARVRKILELEQSLVLNDDTIVPFGQIISLMIR